MVAWEEKGKALVSFVLHFLIWPLCLCKGAIQFVIFRLSLFPRVLARLTNNRPIYPNM